ncbi:hypothetical protein AKG98_1740 [Moritella sp. JT01]|nr:hypothetical protein AKG98_1740 [Moritella sp. JT01]
MQYRAHSDNNSAGDNRRCKFHFDSPIASNKYSILSHIHRNEQVLKRYKCA